MGKKKKVTRKPKKQRKGHQSSQKWKKYEINGDQIKRKMNCPRCGAGVFLGEHKDRYVCGKCGYVEMK